MSKRITTAMFIARAKNIHGDRYNYSDCIYRKSKLKVEITCSEHGKFSQIPSSHLSGSGCPKCFGKFKKTHDEYVDQVCVKNESISVLDKYINDGTKIRHCCLRCEFTWSAAPSDILQGKGCPPCGTKRAQVKNTKSNAAYSAEVQEVFGGNIIVLDNYIKDNSKISHQCRVCNSIWKAIPTNVRRGHGCPKCGQQKAVEAQRKTHNKYTKEVFEISLGNISVIDSYTQSRAPIKHKCNICNNDWMVSPTNILNNRGCPKCKSSHGEKAIAAYLINNNISFETEKSFSGCIYIKELRFDFYLPGYDMCIEFDGIQHFKPASFFGGMESFVKVQARDSVKNNFCLDKKMSLLRISYLEQDEIEKILDAKLKSFGDI